MVQGDGADARSRALAGLCVTEIVSWGVLHDAFPVLVTSTSAETGWSVGAATGAFSLRALVSAGAGHRRRPPRAHGSFPTAFLVLGGATATAALVGPAV